MTKEEKDLLLKDICARLPYGVVAQVSYKDGDGWKTEDRKVLGIYTDEQVYVDCVYTNLENVKPYLRPMSSMTDEELKEFRRLKQMSVTVVMPNGVSLLKPTYIVDLEDDGDGMNYLYDWLNAHHFDYRGLIEKGLALEAPENIYD
jgi:hypothetical protein